MHMGGMAVVGTRAPENYVHVLFNNGAHDSVGGQPTAGLAIDFPAIAAACGYRKVLSVSEKAALTAALEDIGTAAAGPVFLEIKVRKGCRKDLGRPTTKPVQNKEALMDFLKG